MPVTGLEHHSIAENKIMIEQDRAASQYVGSTVGPVTKTLTTGIAKWLARWSSRRDVKKLLRATDHELEDIGLQRSDVERALLFGWREDASERLATIRAERRRAAEWRRRTYADS